jgi:hypothetical protein
MTMADAESFTRMAGRVELIPEEEFGGAVVIRPPGEGDPIEFVTSDPSPNPIQFWGAVKARVEIAYAEALGNSDKGHGGSGW